MMLFVSSRLGNIMVVPSCQNKGESARIASQNWGAQSLSASQSSMPTSNSSRSHATIPRSLVPHFLKLFRSQRSNQQGPKCCPRLAEAALPKRVPSFDSHTLQPSPQGTSGIRLAGRVLVQLWQHRLAGDEHRQGEEEVTPANASKWIHQEKDQIVCLTPKRS